MGNGILELIGRRKDNNEEVTAEIIDRFRLTIKKFSRELNYEEAETDLIICLIELIQGSKLDTIENEGMIVNYIYNTLRNKKIDLFKKHIKGKATNIELNLDILVDNLNTSMEDAIFIEEALKQLNERQRYIIVSRFIDGYSYNEIAQKLGISRQAINKAKNKAIEIMRKKLHIEGAISSEFENIV